MCRPMQTMSKFAVNTWKLYQLPQTATGARQCSCLCYFPIEKKNTIVFSTKKVVQKVKLYCTANIKQG